MPCCGLTEYRQRVPLKYTLAGSVVFWGAFLAAFLFGLLTVFTERGRNVLRIQASFLRSLWQETMRNRDSVPARLSCRLSGRFLDVWPRMAEMIYKHPEIPFIYVPLAGFLLIASAGTMVVRSLR